MRIELTYGGAPLEVGISETHVAGVLEPRAVEPGDEAGTVDAALRTPVDGQGLDAFLDGASSALVVVNDHARSTPTARILEALMPRLSSVRVDFLVASGAHRAPAEDELRVIFGGFHDVARGAIAVHDARNPAETVRIGRTSFGTELLVNRRAAAAERIVLLSSVEPHFFAGFTGGRKSIVPGIAAFSTIEANHAHALSDRSRPAALEGNPVHEDMAEAAGLFLEGREAFSVQTVLDTEGRIAAAFAGGLEGSFEAALEVAREIYCVRIEEPADVVVAVAPAPLDIDFYQSQKALEHGRLAVREGGALILVSECAEGAGESAWVGHYEGAAGPEDVLATLGGPYRLGDHKAARLADLVTKADVSALTSLEPAFLERLFVRPTTSLQETLDELTAERGGACRVLFLPAASVTVPEVALRRDTHV